jgi:transcriptional regulator with XRE-family HTH domain
VYELAAAAGILACTIRRLESGKPADKRVLPSIAAIFELPACRLVCGDHDCVERACVLATAVGNEIFGGALRDMIASEGSAQ